MAIGVPSILTRHLWGIEGTTLDEAVPCWAFAFVCMFTSWEFLKQDHLVRNALDNVYPHRILSYDRIHSSDVIPHRDQVFKMASFRDRYCTAARDHFKSCLINNNRNSFS